MNCGTYEITIPVTGGRYETLRAERIDLLIRLKTGWVIGVKDDKEHYFLNSGSIIRTPEGERYGMDKFPMLSELFNLEKSLEAL